MRNHVAMVGPPTKAGGHFEVDNSVLPVKWSI